MCAGPGSRRERSEPNQDSADDALRRPDDEQLVVDGRRIGGIAEQVAQADEHFPLACPRTLNGSAWFTWTSKRPSRPGAIRSLRATKPLFNL